MIPIEAAQWLFLFGFAGIEIINMALIGLLTAFFSWRLSEMKNAHDEAMLRINADLQATNRAFIELSTRFSNQRGDINVHQSNEMGNQKPPLTQHIYPKSHE